MCSNSQTNGYWMGNDKDAKHLSNDLRSRGLKLLEASRKVELNRQKGGQIVWKDLIQ